ELCRVEPDSRGQADRLPGGNDVRSKFGPQAVKNRPQVRPRLGLRSVRPQQVGEQGALDGTPATGEVHQRRRGRAGTQTRHVDLAMTDPQPSEGADVKGLGHSPPRPPRKTVVATVAQRSINGVSLA